MREKEILELLSNELADRMSESKEKIQEEYNKDKEKYISDFLNSMDSLLKKSKLKQEKNSTVYSESMEKIENLGEIKYIWINCMRVSVETESYKYVIKAYDSSLYNDKNEVEEIYVSEYQRTLIEKDKKYIEKLVMEKVIRAKQYEVRDLQKWYEWNTYMKQMPREIKEGIEKIKELKSYKEVKKERKVKIYYGEMLEIPEREYEL
ncbi:MAG: hypothetical protein IJA34_09345 [Lachnospiraceae bacterium]|nr:hypothetical protein [Lachnospiraceae bacterium]